MNFKNWKIWLSQLPISLKWFVILVLIRPLIDFFYFLKNVSPLLSPIYVIGVLFPLLVIFSFLSKKFPRKHSSFVFDINFSVWSLLVGLNIIFLSLIDFSLDFIGESIKFLTPFFLLFYLRHFIKSKVNLIGILQTAYYSAYIPAILLIYEITFGSINAEYLTDSRGGGARIQGGFADIMNYAIYITAALLTQFYLYIRRAKKNQNTFRHKIILAIVVVMCFIGLAGIKQTSSWAVAFFLVSLFVFFNMNSIKGFLITLLFIPIMIVVGQSIYSDNIKPLVNKEIQVLDGQKDIDRSFNGRAGRWKIFFKIWADMPIISNVIGVSTSGSKHSNIMVSGAMHSEYVRVLFLSGIIGLLLFLSILMLVYKKAKHMKPPERFLIIGALGIIVLYSVSTTPLLYAPLLYYIFPIFAYAALPVIILKK